MGTESVICSWPEEKVLRRPYPYLLSRDYHWVSCTDLLHLCRHNDVIYYRLYTTHFPTIGSLSRCKAGLVVNVIVRKEKGKYVSYLNLPWWLSRMIVWKLPMFQKGRHSCGTAWYGGFHASSTSSFLHFHKNYRASSLDRYLWAGCPQSHLPLVWNTRCGDPKVCSIIYDNYGCHVHHSIKLRYWGEKINSWRRNGSWI